MCEEEEDGFRWFWADTEDALAPNITYRVAPTGTDSCRVAPIGGHIRTGSYRVAPTGDRQQQGGAYRGAH